MSNKLLVEEGVYTFFLKFKKILEKNESKKKKRKE